MLDFKINRDKQTGELFIETSICGKLLLTTPQLNKGTAFTYDERQIFGLLGKLPNRVESLDEQVKRAYFQFLSYSLCCLQAAWLARLQRWPGRTLFNIKFLRF